jgi:putative GTP pyrophosphokinase
VNFVDLESQYNSRYDKVLLPLSQRLDIYIRELIKDYKRVDRVSVRAKSVDRFLAKAQKEEDGKPKYSDPLSQIQDQIGARIVTFYLSDVVQISTMVEDYFSPIEVKHVVPDSPHEFGYEGKHYILFLPLDVKDGSIPEDDYPNFFELQIKTLFQHAWGEADHDLIYKPSGALTSDQRRRVAFTAAQAWGADRIFDELAGELAKAQHGSPGAS